mmetsp:Transcript_28546/g.39831  ORF Transcript_28546/g.39831 Transcript_28546/m.39831 type:complete len:129 (-) Transcript_28546:370-756(-)
MLIVWPAFPDDRPARQKVIVSSHPVRSAGDSAAATSIHVAPSGQQRPIYIHLIPAGLLGAVGSGLAHWTTFEGHEITGLLIADLTDARRANSCTRSDLVRRGLVAQFFQRPFALRRLDEALMRPLRIH